MSGFVSAPGFPPRFVDVPDSVKGPPGPYRQAPPEYGSHWWYVSPFNSATPWIQYGKPVQEPTYPDGFIETFGPRPLAKDYVSGPVTYQEAIVRWEQDLKYFQRAGVPPWIPTGKIPQDVLDIYAAWEMGEPKFYEGHYGWMVRFPQSQLRIYEAAAFSALAVPHLVVAQYQTELASEGIKPSQWHPFTPPHLRGE